MIEQIRHDISHVKLRCRYPRMPTKCEYRSKGRKMLKKKA